VGLSFILAFIGVKLILTYLHEVNDAFPKVPISVSLGVIIVTLTITTVASIIKVRRDPTARAHTGAIGGHGPTERPSDQRPSSRSAD
jgi:tellurite resistance protein TerC